MVADGNMSQHIAKTEFDPYHKWLGIPAEEQPPNHYRLLGLQVFETDPEVIEAAADQRMAHLKTYQLGEHAALSYKLLNEVSAARAWLMDPQRKATYDARLLEARWTPAVSQSSRLPTPGAVPSGSAPAPPTKSPVSASELTSDPYSADLLNELEKIDQPSRPYRSDPFGLISEKLETIRVFRDLMGMNLNHYPVTRRISSEGQYTESFVESQAAD